MMIERRIILKLSSAVVLCVSPFLLILLGFLFCILLLFISFCLSSFRSLSPTLYLPVFVSPRPPVDQCHQDALSSFLLRLPKFLRFIITSWWWDYLLLSAIFQQLPRKAELRGWSFRGNFNILWFSYVRYYGVCRCDDVYVPTFRGSPAKSDHKFCVSFISIPK